MQKPVVSQRGSFEVAMRCITLTSSCKILLIFIAVIIDSLHIFDGTRYNYLIESVRKSIQNLWFRQKRNAPVNPSFTVCKLGLRGSKSHGRVSVMKVLVLQFVTVSWEEAV